MNIIFFSGLIHWLESNMLQCPFKKYTGLDCFGCGLQRSFLFLIKGNFVDSIKMYPATLPLIFVFIFTVFHLIFKFKNGAKIIQIAFIITSIIIIIFYIYKIFAHKLMQ